MRNLKNEMGRTMLEMLGVLAIMGVIIYGAVAGIGFGVTMYQVNASFNDLEELSQGIIDLYSWRSGYPDASSILTAVEKNDIVDAEVGGAGISGRFGSSIIRIVVDDSGANAKNPDFLLVYSGIPELACSRLKNLSYANMSVVETGGSIYGQSPTDCDGDSSVLVLRSR